MKDDDGIVETVQCFWCGKLVGADRALKFDGKRFCTLPHEKKWAAHLKKSGTLRPNDVGRRPKRLKQPVVEPVKQKEGGWFSWLFGKRKKQPNMPKAYRR